MMTPPLMLTLIVALPLLGALLVGLLVRYVGDRPAQLITSGLLVVSAVLSAFVFAEVHAHGPVHAEFFPWITSGKLNVSWGAHADMLTAVMLIVVTWVSSVVHIYSIGYMSHDHSKPRFMAYLSLFTFFMLMLVTADNFVQIFFGWEGVGLASYLLIGFWFTKESANAAAMKAFLVNRVGDVGLAMGIALVFMQTGSVRFADVFPKAEALATQSFVFFGHAVPMLDLMCLLIFVGCMGKSAQILLHTWLPDAMEGPTPVSALIHAATMVTAGVFLTARCSPMFEYAPHALGFVTLIGATTCFFAATIALVQTDIKRVIAYSTCSQLGYMFLACGVSAYSAGVFHLMTHAFFKALLFLCAGSVIHAMSNEQDMRKMGGIWRKIPVTYAFMWIGSLAIAGIPPFAGYYSKDAILEAAYRAPGWWASYGFVLGSAVAFMTAFYSGRLLFLTFHGEPRADHDTMHHVHESPKIMLMPLLLLVAGAIGAGYIGEHVLGMIEPSRQFWQGSVISIHPEPSVEYLSSGHAVHFAERQEKDLPEWVKLLPLILGALGLGLSWIFYIFRPALPGKIAAHAGGLYRFLLNKWYFDELYDAIFVRPALWLGKFFWKQGDERTIDGFGPNGIAKVSMRTGILASRMQTGYLYHYAFVMMGGLLAILSWFAYSTVWRS